MRRAVVIVVMLISGCHYEPSICDSSPGSGCGACTATCDNDHGIGSRAAAECHRRCHEGHWAGGC